MEKVPDNEAGREEGCPPPCAAAAPCRLTGPSPLDPVLPLHPDEALRRFEREASCGLYDTGRYRCRYYSWGSGPPLLFLHGLGETARGYVPVISLLAAHFRCIAYDLPCGGEDGANLGRLTHADLVADLFALLDHLGLRQSYLFGSSFGSTVALAAMHASADRIPRGVLAGGFARRALAPVELLLARLGCYLPGTVGQLPGRRLISRQAVGPSAERRPELFKYFLSVTADTALGALARRALAIHRLDLRPRLPEIRQPVLLVCGDRDPAVGRACEQELLHALPRAARVELSDCAHLPHYSHPEVLAEVVRQFLSPPAGQESAGKFASLDTRSG